MEQMVDVQSPAQAPISARADDPFNGQLVAALESKLAGFSFDNNVGQTVQQVSSPVPVPQPPAVQEVPQSVVSTMPVGDVTSAFMDARASVPAPATTGIEIPPDKPIDPPENMNEKASYAWQEIRAREKAARQAAEQYKAELERITKEAGGVAEERVKFSDEIKQREDRIKELEEELGRLDLAHKPEFHQQFDRPLSDLRGRIRTTLNDAAELEESALDDATDRILKADDRGFDKLVANLSDSAKASLWDKRQEFLNLSAERDRALSDWRNTQVGVEVVDDQRRVVERSQQRRDCAEGAIDYVKNIITPENRPSVLSESTYADDIKNVDQQFRGFMQTANDKEMARMTYMGFLVPVMKRQLAFMTEAMDQWRGAYYQLRGAGKPPAMPMRVQAEAPAAPAAPIPPKVIDNGSFKNTVESTVENILSRAGLH